MSLVIANCAREYDLKTFQNENRIDVERDCSDKSRAIQDFVPITR